MTIEPLDLDAIERGMKSRDWDREDYAYRLLADARASRIEINRLTAMAAADAFEIGRSNAEGNKLREERDEALRFISGCTDPDLNCDGTTFAIFDRVSDDAADLAIVKIAHERKATIPTQISAPGR